jgi:hypothetical protein
MGHSALRCPDIQTTGIPIGSIPAAPGSNYGQLMHQMNKKFSPQYLYRFTRETPDSICKKLNRMAQTYVIYVP